MKIAAISDLHGILPRIVDPEFDVLCICGDISPKDIERDIEQATNWITEKFIPWCENLPCRQVLLIAGNHDFLFTSLSSDFIYSLFENTKIKYLQDELCTIDSKIFYGTPWCRKFRSNNAFVEETSVLVEQFSNIPDNVDVLLAHDAPYGVSDICLQESFHTMKEHFGNIPLRDAVYKHKPKYLLHGHLHSSNHYKEFLGDTQVYNVSILDEYNNLTYLPLILTI